VSLWPNPLVQPTRMKPRAADQARLGMNIHYRGRL
jgi:hypothetical protein